MRALIVLCSLGVSVSAGGDEHDVLSRDELAARYPGLRADDIHDGPISGTYEVVRAGRVTYVTTDGRLLIRGDIIDLESNENLTETRRAADRATMLATIDPATMIVFSPPDGVVEHRITVFTDVDCGYCRQFHRDIGNVNALGIEVRYVAYPRTGPGTDSWTKAIRVWCSPDRQSALTSAKLGSEVPDIGCAADSVATHYALAQQLRLNGTPGIYSETGTDIGGYLPPNDLLARLEGLAGPR